VLDMRNRHVNKLLSALTGKRKVYFLAENPYSASTTVRGTLISDQLNKCGVYSSVVDLKYESLTGFSKVKQIKNSHIIVIKRGFQDTGDLLKTLKNKKNILIWDPLDELSNLIKDDKIRIFDGIIWANQKCAEDMHKYLHNGCRGAVIHHHWDPQCRPNRAKGYKMVFLGDPTPENIDSQYIDNIKDINIERCSNLNHMRENNLFEKAMDYNCHFSVRKEGADSFKYKPNAQHP